MNATVEDLRPTIIPKSDQLNAEQLLGGPMTVTVSSVRVTDSAEQPVVVHYEGEDGRPYKPCKTMRKVLLHAWGADGSKWPGRSMTLYNDPAVKFGGEDVGGIRISHISDIERDIKVSLTSTRGKKAKYEIRRLVVDRTAAARAAIKAADSIESLKATFAHAYKAAKDASTRADLKASYDARTAELSAPPTPQTFDADAFRRRIESCTDAAVLDLVADELRDLPEGDQRTELTEAYRRRLAEIGGAA